MRFAWNVADNMSDYLMPTYARLPVTFVRGQGAWLEDEQGGRYLDALSGIAVCGLGHAHPGVAAAVRAQAETLVHTSNLYRIPIQETLGQRLCELSGMQRVFFANSGAEANEAALKLARLHGHRRGIATPRVVVMEQAFHGRTLMTLSATGNAKAQAGFEPLVEGFVRAPYNDLDAVAALAGTHDDIVAVMVEPVQGEGGIRIPDPGYLAGLRELCDKHGWLLICDEIQSGMARTGRWLASDHDAARPDVVTLAKALGNGVPIGACMARGEAAEVLGPGSHGSTFGGNPLACAAAGAVLDIIVGDQLATRAATLGEYMQQQLRAALGEHPRVTNIRGRGLMLAVELDRPCPDLVKLALAEGLLINVTAERVIRLLPPLITTDHEADQIVARLVATIGAWQSRNAEEPA